MNSRSNSRVIDSSCYVLHTTPWRETSVLAKVFSREHGIVLAMAKGAKRPYSGLRTVLQSFQPLLLSWSGRADVKTLTHAEVCGIHPLPARVLMSCWYMSEIVLKLLPREDSHPLLFDAYSCALQSLALGEPQAITLRRFEWTLLREIGYGIDGQLPDFADPAQAETLRHLIRQRLEEYLPDTDLLSRKVMLSLRQN